MKSKNLIKLIIGITLVAVMAVAIPLMSGCAAPAPTPGEPTPTPEPAAEEPTFHWRSQAACWGPPQTADILIPWAEEIKKASGGRLVIDMYSDGELMTSDELMPSLMAGTMDMTTGTSMCWGGAPFPIADIDGAAPFMWSSPLELWALLDHYGLGDVMKEGFESFGGIHCLGFWSTDPNHIQSTRPIRSLADLDGLKLNTFAAQADILAEFGVSSVALPLEEWYLGGQTGVVDALLWMGSKESSAQSIHEPFPYFLNNPFSGCWLADTLISQKSWDALPPDLQGILELAAGEFSRTTLAYFAWGEFTTRHFYEITEIPEEEWAEIAKVGIAYWDEAAKQNEYMARAVAIVKQYHKDAGTPGWE